MEWLLPYATGQKPYPYFDIEESGWIPGNADELLWFASIAHQNATLWKAIPDILGFDAADFDKSPMHLYLPLPFGALTGAQ